MLDLHLIEKGKTMDTKDKTLEQVIEKGESIFPEITSLYQCSGNYAPGQTPMTLFLDLIGYSEEMIGSSLYDMNSTPLGYLEMDYLGDALKEYASKGQIAYEYVCELLDAEGRQYEEENN